MFIRSLHLQNFLSHEDTTLALEKLTVLRGSNGAGKSSVEQALEYLLCARAEATDDRGSGAKEMIRRGQSKAYITAEIVQDEIARKLRCTLTEKSGRELRAKRDDDPSYTGTDWIDSLAAQKDVLSCLINGRHFVDMDAARQKDLLAAIVLPAHVEWPEWIKEAMVSAKIAVNWSLAPFDFISAVYDAAYKERTGVNRELKSWKAPENPESVTLSVDQIRDRLRERQNERTDLAVRRQKMADAIARSQEKQHALQKKLESVTLKLREEQQRFEDSEKLLLSDKKLRDLEKIAGQSKLAIGVDAEISQVNAQIEAQKKQMLEISGLVEIGQCPTCSQKTTAQVLDKILRDAGAVLGDLQKKVTMLYHERKEIGDYAEAQNQIDAHKEATNDLKLIRERVQQLEQSKAELGREWNEPVESLPSPETLDPEIAELDARIEKGSAALQSAVRAQERQKAYDAAMATKSALDAKLATLERLVEYFGPKGVQAELLDKHVGGFERAMNQVLEKWGFACQLQFDPYSFGIRFADSEHFLSLRTISKSQRYRFACAFQIALAQASGFRFAVLDGADILDADGRGKLYAALRDADMDQIIVMQTDDRRAVPQAEHTAFYMLSAQVANGVPTTNAERL